MTDVMDTVSYMERVRKHSHEALRAAYELVNDEDEFTNNGDSDKTWFSVFREQHPIRESS